MGNRESVARNAFAVYRRDGIRADVDTALRHADTDDKRVGA